MSQIDYLFKKVERPANLKFEEGYLFSQMDSKKLKYRSGLFLVVRYVFLFIALLSPHPRFSLLTNIKSFSHWIKELISKLELIILLIIDKIEIDVLTIG